LCFEEAIVSFVPAGIGGRSIRGFLESGGTCLGSLKVKKNPENYSSFKV